MSGQIFISYRREDTEGYTGRLYDRLQERFPHQKIFMDVDSVEPGVDFAKAIQESVGSCDVLVAVIGKRWLTASEGRSRRLDHPQDYVRLEIGTALRRGIRVIPVLVEGASMPPPGQLPDELKALTRRQALAISHERFPADAERLTGAVERALQNARVEQEERDHAAEPRGREGNGRPELGGNLREKGTGAGSWGPPADWVAPKGGTANLKRPGRLLMAMGIGVAVCLLGFGLFKAKRPQPVLIGGSSSPTPAPLAAASNSTNPTPLVGQASPSPRPFGAERLAVAASSVPIPTAAPLTSPAIPIRQGSTLVRESSAPLTRPSVSLLATPTLAPPNPLSPAPSAGQASTSLTPSGADWLAEAGRYLKVKDYVQALPPLQKAAETGNAEAMRQLAGLYYWGHGVEQSYAQAFQWYQKAAVAGDPEAMYQLARLYHRGEGVARDDERVHEWLEKAANAGNLRATIALGLASAGYNPYIDFDF